MKCKCEYECCIMDDFYCICRHDGDINYFHEKVANFYEELLGNIRTSYTSASDHCIFFLSQSLQINQMKYSFQLIVMKNVLLRFSMF